jgi:integrase/recombinase XerD
MSQKETEDIMARKKGWADMDKSRIAFGKLREAYAVFSTTGGKSPHTVKWYDDRLALFQRFLGVDAKLGDLAVAKVREFVSSLQDQRELYLNNPRVRRQGKLSTSYILGFVRALRAFASWLYEDGYTDANLLKPLRPPRIQQKVTEVLSDEEINRLLTSLDPHEAFGARYLAMVWTLLDCGLRASELCGLTLENAHLEEGYLKVLGKGNKERLVPIGRNCQSALTRWRDRYHLEFEVIERPQVLWGASGKPLTPASLEKVVKRVATNAGLPRVHCHLLCHTFATNYLGLATRCACNKSSATRAWKWFGATWRLRTSRAVLSRRVPRRWTSSLSHRITPDNRVMSSRRVLAEYLRLDHSCLLRDGLSQFSSGDLETRLQPCEVGT